MNGPEIVLMLFLLRLVLPLSLLLWLGERVRQGEMRRFYPQ
jgi:hypothetical protein